MSDIQVQNHSKKKVAIIGAGFSGLSLARYLVQAGISCEIFEATDRCGGLIKTERKEGLLVESAANAILASTEVEKLFSDLNIPFEKAGFKSNSRHIFRKKPSTFPFNFFEFSFLIFNFLKAIVLRNIKPLEQESLTDWSLRVGGEKFRNYLLEPAVGGVYAASTHELSAFLVLAAFFNPELKVKKTKLKGSLSPTEGMQKIIDSLLEYLNSKEVRLHYNSKVKVEDLKNDFNFVVVAASLKNLKEIVNDQDYNLSNDYNQTSQLDISTVTIAPSKEKLLKGFGCLFPRSENFKSLGVLFNTDIFANRGETASETWILPFVSDDEKVVQHVIANDRLRLHLEESDFKILNIQPWPKTLPTYNNELLLFLKGESFLKKQNENSLQVFIEGARLKYPQKFVYLTGNYLGGLGLSKILDYNLRLTQKIKMDLYEVTHS
jgi:oxygen-dependent protoporphyrinogen oxidase